VRSPSQNKSERRICLCHTRLIDVYSSSSKTIDALEIELPSGVEVEIKV
jgi:ribosomal protein S10